MASEESSRIHPNGKCFACTRDKNILIQHSTWIEVLKVIHSHPNIPFTHSSYKVIFSDNYQVQVTIIRGFFNFTIYPLGCDVMIRTV